MVDDQLKYPVEIDMFHYIFLLGNIVVIFIGSFIIKLRKGKCDNH